MKSEVVELMEQHWKWLRDNTAIRELDSSVVEITTPYLDRHNDMLQIYVQKSDDGFLISDDGYIIHDLEISGCKLDSPKRKALLRETLNGFGVELKNDSIEVRTSPGNFGHKKHSLVQAMLAVNDLFSLSTPMVSSLFLEDVQSWLEKEDIRFTSKVKFSGKSGFDHLFDFVIPKSRNSAERLVQAVNRPSRDTAEAAAFKWVDTKDVRPPKSIAYAILNDAEHQISSNITDAMDSYGIKPIRWSEREKYREQLAA